MSRARRTDRRAVRALAVAAGLLIPAAASAQTSVTGVPAERPDQNPARPAAPVAPPVATRNARQANAPIAPFLLRSVTVAGTSLPPAALASAYAPYIGRRIDNAALAAITNAVAAAYARSDVALYTILVPDQRFAGGALQLVAVEGYIGAVEVRGELRALRKQRLQAYLRRLERERPLHTSTLQRVLSLIRDMPGFYPDMSLSAGDAQGAVKLMIVAHEKPVQIGVGINDRGTALLGRTQVQADASLNGLFGGADQLRLTGVVPTQVSHFQYVGGAYTAPLNDDGTSVTANLSYLRTRPSAFPLKGNAVSFGLQFSHPIIRSYARSLTATVGVDAINSDNALLGFVLSNDRVRTLRAALSYVGAGKRNQLSASVTGSFGLDIAGARIVRGQARRGFRKLNVKLGDAAQIGKAVVLRLNGFAQLTPDDLPSSEQIALGGDEFGRAYEAALIAGDTGYAGSAELAWRPQAGLPKLLAGSELYAFADGGRVRYRSRFGYPAVPQHLASIGAGARAQIAARSVVQIEAVRGLNDPVFYRDHTRTRVLFSIRSLL